MLFYEIEAILEGNVFFLQNIRRPGNLYSEVVEIDCRVIPVLEGKCELGDEIKNWRIVQGNTGENFYITKELVKDDVKNSLLNLKDKGINSISVVLAHSYTYFEHELEVGKIAKELGR